ncbi:MAG: ClpXP protease specificity-enhancing factor [Burkholderiales bacterium]
MGEIPTKPYLLRALYEWCVDNGYTPHLAVKVDAQTRVPPEHVRNGEITLNVSPGAVHQLQMGNEMIEFSARFAGAARELSVPVANVYALYARETGHGMTFEVDLSKPALQADAESEPVVLPAAPPAPADEAPVPPKPPAGKPRLRRVK